MISSQIMRKRAIKVIYFLLLLVPGKLIEHALTGWADDQIAKWLGISSATDVFKLVWRWAVPVLIAAALFALLLWTYHVALSRLAPTRTNDTAQPSAANGSQDTFMPLGEAVSTAYTQLRAANSPCAESADGVTEKLTPDERMNFIAHMLSVDVPIYGKRHPSTRIDPYPIKKFDVTMGLITDDATKLRRRHDHAVLYSELAVRREDLRKLLDEAKTPS